MTIPAFRKKILTWYATNQRNLPWRLTRDPYKILVSEIMLQQTQVSRVLPKYEEFLKTFPTLEALANAKESHVLTAWSGLGYWRRAKFLQATAQEIITKHNGHFPKTPAELKQLPGIGPYTAGAVACFAFGSTEAFIDTNIRRVYLHFFFPDQKNVSDKEILEVAQTVIDDLERSDLAKFAATPSMRPRRRNSTSREHAQVVTKKLAKPSGKAAGNLRLRRDSPAASLSVRDWHWALFDYSATELKTNPVNRRSRHYAKQSPFTGSFRSFRAKTIKHLLAAPNHQQNRHQLLDWLEDQIRSAEKDYSAEEIIAALLNDELIKQRQDFLYL